MTSKTETKLRLQKIAFEQGWTDVTAIGLMLNFIEERELLEELADAFQDTADEENEIHY